MQLYKSLGISVPLYYTDNCTVAIGPLLVTWHINDPHPRPLWQVTQRVKHLLVIWVEILKFLWPLHDNWLQPIMVDERKDMQTQIGLNEYDTQVNNQIHVLAHKWSHYYCPPVGGAVGL